MALGKRASQDLAVILEGDPSIIGGDYQKYKESFFDEKHLELDAQDPPTRWTIRQLSSEHKDMIAGCSTIREQAKLGVRCGLVALRNYKILKRDGSIDEVGAVDFEDHRVGKLVALKWLNDLNLPSEHLAKLYLLIDYISEAQLPLSKRSDNPSGASPQEKRENLEAKL